jgi:hypothetical protein
MAAGARPGRKWIVVGLLAVFALFGWWMVDRQLEPQRLTATVLTRLGDALKLDFAFDGMPEYALRPEPRLRVPNLVVTDPVTGKVVLRAEELEVTVPWATVRGGPLVITRLDLRKPTLDVAGLRRWLAARPEAPFELPTLSRGMRVSDGTVRGDGWELRQLALDLPHLSSGAPVELDYAMQFVRGTTLVALKGKAHADAARATSPFLVHAGVALARAPEPMSGALLLRGRYAFADAGFSLDTDTLRIDGQSPLPQLIGRLHVGHRDELVADFAGELATWPEDWPALPMPLAVADGPFPLTLGYRGRTDFSDPVTLGLSMDQARLDAQVRVGQMLAWLDAPPASPLPPLAGLLTLPQLDLGGITLRGVRVEMHEDALEPAVEPEEGAGAP